MQNKFIKVRGVPAVPLTIGEKAVIFHSQGYTRTGKVLSMHHFRAGIYLLVTEGAVYWITPDVTRPAQSAANALCA
jgi:hypothetical protein